MVNNTVEICRETVDFSGCAHVSTYNSYRNVNFFRIERILTLNIPSTDYYFSADQFFNNMAVLEEKVVRTEEYNSSYRDLEFATERCKDVRTHAMAELEARDPFAYESCKEQARSNIQRIQESSVTDRALAQNKGGFFAGVPDQDSNPEAR